MTPFSPLLQALSRDDLLVIVDHFAIPVPDRRAKTGLINAVATLQDARIGEALGTLSRDRLKELCREQGLEDSGREKSVLIQRLSALIPNPRVLRAASDVPPSSPPSTSSWTRP